MTEMKWIDMARYHPCPTCGAEGICFGPPDAAGGERFSLDAVYCEYCGVVYEVCQWTEQGKLRFGRLEKVPESGN